LHARFSARVNFRFRFAIELSAISSPRSKSFGRPERRVPRPELQPTGNFVRDIAEVDVIGEAPDCLEDPFLHAHFQSVMDFRSVASTADRTARAQY
jgi:hypothetical protein